MNKDITDEEVESLKEEIALNRIGEPKEVANCVKLLIENEYITGQVITVDRRMGYIRTKFVFLDLFSTI